MNPVINSIPAFPIRPSGAPAARPAAVDTPAVPGHEGGPQRGAVDMAFRPLVDVSGLTTAQAAATAPAESAQPAAKTKSAQCENGPNCDCCGDKDAVPGSGKGETGRKTLGGLSDEEKEVVDKLAAVDREVRAHEQAHAVAGGGYAGSPQYTYETGPDGKRYAVAGSVSIDTSPVPDNPRATIQKMEVVKRAALAPHDPSGADRAVAATADKQKAEAQAELNKQQAEELQKALGGPEDGGKPDGSTDAGKTSDQTAGASDAGFKPFVPGNTFGNAGNGSNIGASGNGAGHNAGIFDSFAGTPDHSRAAFAHATSAYAATSHRDAIDQPGIL